MLVKNLTKRSFVLASGIFNSNSIKDLTENEYSFLCKGYGIDNFLKIAKEEKTESVEEVEEKTKKKKKAE